MRLHVKDKEKRTRKSEGRGNWGAPGNGKAWATNLRKEVGLSIRTTGVKPSGDSSESDTRWSWRNVGTFLSLN